MNIELTLDKIVSIKIQYRTGAMDGYKWVELIATNDKGEKQEINFFNVVGKEIEIERDH